MRYLVLYVLLDRKVRAYGQIMASPNEEAMRRELTGLAGTDTMQAKYPEDFDLYRIGVYDTELGLIAAETPELVARLAGILAGVVEQPTLFEPRKVG